MIVCPKCKTDNMIGAIFCRGCGDKLNIDDLRPEDIERAAPREKKGPGVLRNFLALVFLLAVAAVLIMLFLRPSFTATASLADETMLKAAKDRVLILINPKTLHQTPVTFSRIEALTLARHQMGLTPEQVTASKQKAIETGTNLNLQPVDIDFEFLSASQAKFILRSVLMNKLDVYTTVICDLSVGPDGGVKFQPVQAYMGRVPLYFGPLIDKCVERFTLLTAGNKDLDNLDKCIGSVAFDGDKVKFTKK